MDLRPSTADEEFRAELREWLETELARDFGAVRGRGGPGDEEACFDERLAWERHLAAHGWTCTGWPAEHGGRGLSVSQQVIFHEEYARARAPGRIGHFGEMLLGPTVIAFGTPEQQARFLPPIVAATEFWCQGYSEPDAGSDLASLKTRAELDGDEWVINGQKVWTSLAQWAQWCFVLCRTDPNADPKHRGISYLLVPMDQPGIEIRPIRQIGGSAEFNEVFFHDARTPAENVVGDVNGGWKVAMGTLAFERGVSTLGQQHQFANELQVVIDVARKNGAIDDPVVRDRLAAIWGRLRIMSLSALRVLATTDPVAPIAMIHKLYWSNLHRDLGELAMDVIGADSLLIEDGPYEPTLEQKAFFFSRADTIYAGSNEIQRNLIGERALGLPR